MPKKIDQNVFESILEPVNSMIKKSGNDIEDDEEKYNLSFVPFTTDLVTRGDFTPGFLDTFLFEGRISDFNLE